MLHVIFAIMCHLLSCRLLLVFEFCSWSLRKWLNKYNTSEVSLFEGLLLLVCHNTSAHHLIRNAAKVDSPQQFPRPLILQVFVSGKDCPVWGSHSFCTFIPLCAEQMHRDAGANMRTCGRCYLKWCKGALICKQHLENDRAAAIQEMKSTSFQHNVLHHFTVAHLKNRSLPSAKV